MEVLVRLVRGPAKVSGDLVVLLDFGPATVEVSEGLVVLQRLDRRAGNGTGDLVILESLGSGAGKLGEDLMLVERLGQRARWPTISCL
jgi:hypothetical protein